ncbi:tetratricopeptide repeat protein [Aquidulcibacter sp.]|uniref:tetratricopeptide repeat protein n=1 Tax=Aquidulcibacter sp. TaxID=2052990 RepID=UPI003BA48213
MAKLRRLLAYVVCVALASPPMAYGQNAAPAGGAAPSALAGLKGVTLSSSQDSTYARLLIAWPAGTNLSATAVATPNNGLAMIRLPRAIEADPTAFAKGAPDFVASAALSTDKRTIRVALLQPTRVITSRVGNVQAFDFVMSNAEAPPPFEGEAKAMAAANTADKAGEGPVDESGPPKKMINGAAPVGAPKIQVDVFEAKEFTRLRLSRVGNQFPLPAHGYARRGDRLAIALPGKFAFDTAAIRNRPPARVEDAARYNSDTDSSFLLDVAPGSVVRHSRDGNAILIDILPEGANPDTIQALQDEAGGKIGSPEPKSVAGKQGALKDPKAGETDGTPPEAKTAEAQASEMDAEALLAQRPDPAPSGRVRMSSAMVGKELQLEFDFETPAPAAVYRRGDSIYVLFATAADMDVGRVPSGKFVSRIEKVRGEGVSGIRIVAPPEVQATPTSFGPKWKVVLSPQRQAAGRSIGLVREQALDGTSRVKALVPDGAATGMITDPAVGDTLLIGLALGPNSSLGTQRSYLEAVLPETFHGLVVVPRTDDFALRRDVDGFVLVRPQGMALSGLAPADELGAGPATAPGFIDFKTWRLGPKADFTNNLNKLRRKAAIELGDTNNKISARLDLARFLVAWDLGAEASGVIRQLRSDVPALERSPELLALEGIATLMGGHGKAALDLLSEPEVAEDPAAQLWAGLAAQVSGNSSEARVRFERGKTALQNFEPEYRARFNIANGNAALELGDGALASMTGSSAQREAQDSLTQLQAALLAARAMGATGRVNEALVALTKLATAPDREIAARAAYEKANLGESSGKIPAIESIKALDALRYTWRGDDLELDILRRLGGLYIQAGDIRSGLTTMASASTLRPDLPAARRLRDDLFQQFKFLFLEGGADGMDPIQALALFYDFRTLAPIGPDGDRMVRGLAERLVALDLLPQATQLLQHQVDKRLEGFSKSQVATDLAALYLMDRRPEEALRAIWNSRVSLLPEPLNEQRRLIEAASLAELGRKDHALETIEFDDSPDAARVRTEIYMRAGDWPNAAANARASLPPAQAALSPEDAGEVLRVAVAQAMAREDGFNRGLVRTYGPAMSKSAYAEAFKVVTDSAIPSNASLQSAVKIATGGSPYDGLMRRLRDRLNRIEAPTEAEAVQAARAIGPTDGNPNGRLSAALLSVLPKALQPEGIAKEAAPLLPDVRPSLPPQRSPAVASVPPRAPARPANAAPRTAQNQAKAPARPAARAGVDAPRDPPPAPIVGR